MQDLLSAPQRTLRRCLVCGSSELRTDEVVDRGIVLLAECARCDHRSTHAVGAVPAAAPAPLRVQRAVLREAADAA